MVLARRVLLLGAFASACGTLLPQAGLPVRPRSDLQTILRCRGGAGDHSSSSLNRAVHKLCSQPGLIASTGQKEGGFSAIAKKHVRGVVFGGMDGILTTFALLAAVEGSKQTSSTLTLVIGVSTVLADALSMGAGEYLSAKAEDELQGPGGEDEPGPLEKGLAMFLAFTLFGSLPLIGSVISTSLSRSVSASSSFTLSVSITGITLFALGAIKSQFGAGVWWQAGAEVAGIGGAAATVAYITARAVESVMGES